MGDSTQVLLQALLHSMRFTRASQPPSATCTRGRQASWRSDSRAFATPGPVLATTGADWWASRTPKTHSRDPSRRSLLAQGDGGSARGSRFTALSGGHASVPVRCSWGSLIVAFAARRGTPLQPLGAFGDHDRGRRAWSGCHPCSLDRGRL